MLQYLFKAYAGHNMPLINDCYDSAKLCSLHVCVCVKFCRIHQFHMFICLMEYKWKCPWIGSFMLIYNTIQLWFESVGHMTWKLLNNNISNTNKTQMKDIFKCKYSYEISEALKI